MKNLFKEKVVQILTFLSRKTLAKYQPIIIAVTGNVGKTTTKDYIYSFLKFKFREDEVRASEKSQNSEFGVNLTILGESNAWANPVLWLKIIFRNLWRLFLNINYPKILVLEVGADKPGDIRYITTIIKPDVVVLTAFQPSPTHGEFFLNVEQHINEKKILVDKMKKNGIIVYNADDAIMSNMAIEKQITNPKIQIFSYGYKVGSNITILENSNLYNEEAEIIGLKTKLQINFGKISEVLEFRVPGVIGNAQTYSLAAAVCVSLLNEFDKHDFQRLAQNFEQTLTLAKSRMRILQGIHGSKIIDDSYNSSPLASENAIETVSKILNKGKKTAILGHMAELGEKTKEEHFKIGLLASKYFDLIILSGRYNEYFLEGIREGKFDLKNVYLAKNSQEVVKILQENNLVKENDLILVKGSQSARLEKVVVALLMNAHDRDYVCRQEEEWQKR